MTKPVRIQLSRRKGFNLQAVSIALNGLPAVKVDRTTKWGNPFVHESRAEAVAEFRTLTPAEMGNPALLEGVNLACWCPLDQPCHADVLLEIANSSQSSSPALIAQGET